MEIRFELTPCKETGGCVARWDDPAGGGICTQGDNFADQEKPERIRLHFVSDPELAVA